MCGHSKSAATDGGQNAGDDDVSNLGGGVDAEHDDPRLGTFNHPTKGSFSTYMFANERNTRLFFDEVRKLYDESAGGGIIADDRR